MRCSSSGQNLCLGHCKEKEKTNKQKKMAVTIPPRQKRLLFRVLPQKASVRSMPLACHTGLGGRSEAGSVHVDL